MNNKHSKEIIYISKAGLIASVYAVLSVVLAPFSFGVLQYRASEALSVLLGFMPEALPGLILGCLISNIFGGNGLTDIIFGTLATALAGIITRSLIKHLKNKFIAIVLPTVFINGVIVGLELSYIYSLPFIATAMQVAGSEAIVMLTLGTALYAFLEKNNVINNDNRR